MTEPGRAIFISWSGESSRGHDVARALRAWLPCFWEDLDCWISGDVEPGERWTVKLAARLASTHTGIFCVTPQTVASPWVNFEAGAISQSVAGEKARVIPYVVRKASFRADSPLGQFQRLAATREGTLKLLTAIRKPLRLDREDLQRFEAFWPDLARVITARNHQAAAAAVNRIEKLGETLRSLELREVHVSPGTIRAGQTLKMEYVIESSVDGIECWLGACVYTPEESRRPIYNEREDTAVTIKRGHRIYRRTLTIPSRRRPGAYQVKAEVFYGRTSKSDRSFSLRTLYPQCPIRVE